MGYVLEDSPEFRRDYKKLPQSLKDKTKEKLLLLRTDPFQNVLKTHKLKGKLKDFWACSVDYENRILFYFLNDTTIRLLSVGNHSIYR